MTIWRRRLAVAGILALAAGVRLWGLTAYPPGLFPDQAANGEDALEILSGDLQVFSLRNNGRESLFFYAQAATVGLFGVGVWQLFLASAIVGTATVGLTYLAGARLLGAGPALLASLFLATNSWHVTLSRTGFRAVTTPLCIALALWCLARVLQTRERAPRISGALLAGAAVGLSLYTYTAARAFLLFFFLAGILALLRYLLQPSFRPRARVLARAVGIAVLAAVVVVAPLVGFFLRHPESVGVRAQHVSIFNPDLNEGSPARTLFRMTGRTLRAFVWNGDGNPRHNVPLPGLPYTTGGIHAYEGGGAPFLSFVPALLAMVGVGVAAGRAPWLLLLFVVMLLPAVTTAEGIPHGLRTAGAIPAHVWLAGLGGAWLWRALRSSTAVSVRVISGLAVSVLLVLTAAADVWWYFGVARNTPLAHYEYRADLTEVSRYLNENAKRKVQNAKFPYLVLDDFSVQTVHFLTRPTGHPYVLLRPATSHLRALAPGEEMLFAQSSLTDASRYLMQHPAVRVREDRANRFGETTMLVLVPR